MRRTEQLHGHGANRSQMGARLGFDALMTGRVDPRSLNRNGDLDMLRDERVAQTTDARNAADQATAAQAARQKAANTGTTDDAAPSKIAFWTGGAIQIGRRDATTNRARMSVTTAGLSGGADLRVSERLTIGIGGGYGNDVTRIGHGDGRVSSHDAVGAGYFSAVPVDGAFIDGVAGYGALHFRTRRLAPGNGATALGDRDGQLGFASFSTGIDRSDDALRWSLYGRGDYQRAVLEAYAESGADMFNLRFGRRVVESLTSVLGGRVALSRPVSFGAITPWLRAEWSHEFQGSGRQSVDYADIAGPALYGIDTQGWGGEQFSLSFGNQLDVNGWSLGLEVGLRAANKERAGTAKVGASTKF
jgi:hypothetical protein